MCTMCVYRGTVSELEHVKQTLEREKENLQVNLLSCLLATVTSVDISDRSQQFVFIKYYYYFTSVCQYVIIKTFLWIIFHAYLLLLCKMH